MTKPINPFELIEDLARLSNSNYNELSSAIDLSNQLLDKLGELALEEPKHCWNLPDPIGDMFADVLNLYRRLKLLQNEAPGL